MTYSSLSVVDRFWLKVRRGAADSCWVWGAFRNRDGYGVIKNNYKQVLAHRLSYQIANPRESLAGMVVMHKCDNPPCVNPSHLRLGTASENSLDMSAKNRNSTARGEKVWCSKLTEDAVVEIRSQYKRYQPGQTRNFAFKYGVSIGTICKAANGKQWKKTQGE